MNNKTSNRRSLDQIQRLYLVLLVFSASLLASAIVILQNNAMRTIALFMFLLFFGSGIMLTLGLVRGVLLNLFLLTVWILVKKQLGVWEQVTLLNNLLELTMASITFLFAGVYHNRLQAFLKTYQHYQSQLKRLDLEEKSIGLLKPSVGLLRLSEEEERSLRYRRPFALVLIMARPAPGVTWAAKEPSELMRAIATTIKDTTRETDVHFLAEDNKIAVILPETETVGASKVVNNIFNRMILTQFITSSGEAMFLHTRTQLRYGFAAFLGVHDVKAHMMTEAERSLQRSLEINSDDLFQNIFMEWATIGEVPVSTPLIK